MLKRVPSALGNDTSCFSEFDRKMLFCSEICLFSGSHPICFLIYFDFKQDVLLSLKFRPVFNFPLLNIDLVHTKSMTYVIPTFYQFTLQR